MNAIKYKNCERRIYTKKDHITVQSFNQRSFPKNVVINSSLLDYFGFQFSPYSGIPFHYLLIYIYIYNRNSEKTEHHSLILI